MNILKKINQNDFFGIITISLFSLGVNQFYGNFGVFPHDSFSHFGTAHMIMNGFHPFKDFWIVSGPFIDYFQAFLFKLFGTSWTVYVFHASLTNLLISVSTFILLRNFNLELKKSIFYSLCLSVLAYPTSGTPFVDHHSAFFSLIGIYLILICIKNESKKICFFISLFFLLGFFSKQVPSAYLAITVIPIFLSYLLLNKKNYLVLHFFYGCLFFVFLFLLFGFINGISFKDFLEQYIFYPQSIAKSRFENINIYLFGIIGNFKFIFISLLILIVIKAKNFTVKNTKKLNILFKSKDNFILLIILVSTFVFIFHQVFTRNQIFIFFLIPLILGIASIYINRKILNYFVLALCMFTTIKYHERFNENRKFHELQNVNLELAIDAKAIDNRLSGLNWITPQFSNEPLKEIKNINEIKIILKNDNRTKMVFGNYSFLSVILDQNLFYTTRWHVFDGSDYPLPQNKHFSSYKRIANQLISENKIKVIYSLKPVKSKNIYDLINRECLKEKKLNDFVIRFEFKTC